MNKYLNKLLILVLCTSTLTLAYASNIDHVNVGRIKVSDQSLRSQQNAGKQALAQVFIKLSGNPQVLNEPQIAKAVDNFEQFLTASSFLQINGQFILEATFNRQKVESLLMASGLSVWASLRPSAALWLGLKSPNNQQVVLYQNQPLQNAENVSLVDLVDLHAYSRGVEIIVPIGDLEDTSKVSVYDVWNQFISHLYDHNLRYGSDYLISATMQAYSFEEHNALIERRASSQREFEQTQDFLSGPEQGDEDDSPISIAEGPSSNVQSEDLLLEDDLNDVEQNDAAVSLLETAPINEIPAIDEDTSHKIDYVITNKKQVHTGTIYANSATTAVQKLVDSYANMLAEQFALSNDSQTENLSPVYLLVNDINSLSDYVDLLKLIQSIPAVNEVRLFKQEQQQSTILIKQNISIAQLRSILALDPRLRLEASNRGNDSLIFSWQK